MPYEITNPRFFPGNISGLSMEHESTGRAVDTRYGVNLNDTDGCLIAHPQPDDITIAYAMGGTIDDTHDHVRALYLLNPGMAGVVVHDLAVLLHRCDPTGAVAVVDRLHRMVYPPATEPEAAIVAGGDTEEDCLAA
jgi:hypothetical protein